MNAFWIAVFAASFVVALIAAAFAVREWLEGFLTPAAAVTAVVGRRRRAGRDGNGPR